MVSARALSSLSPTLPTEGSMPAATSRSVYLIETWCTPRSLWGRDCRGRAGARAGPAPARPRTKPA